jgi:DNA replication and repair protein RecF
MHGELTHLPPHSVSLVYRTNVAGLDQDEYRALLAEQRSTDRARSSTHLGPHRDDLRFMLTDRDVREYGSQGEQRSVLLALLLAEAEWLAAERGRAPLLLLDDVMSELDYQRRRALLRLLSGRGQAVITTTTLDYFTSEELARATVVDIGPATA